MSIAERYVLEVLHNLVVEEEMKRRIEKDLYSQIAELSESEDVTMVIERMGSPEDVAREFMDSIYDDEGQINALIQERVKKELAQNQAYEYRSRATLFGLPLVHIHTRRSGKPRVAKGIIAMGDIAVGFISLGAIALGGISLGAVSLGLLALGGLALGGLASGGLAIGLVAIGGLAIGEIAMGGLAIGNLAVGGRAIGEFALDKEFDVITRDTVQE